jgi:DNA polymerase III subunit chi
LTEVFFYHGASDRLAAATSLLAGAWTKRKPVLVFAPDAEVAGLLDRQLWTHAALSFVPHCRADSPLAAETPIRITTDLASAGQEDRLLTLAESLPPDFMRFRSIIEVVGQDEAQRNAGRARVQVYREQGCTVRFFDLTSR